MLRGRLQSQKKKRKLVNGFDGTPGWDQQKTCPGHVHVAVEQVGDGQLSSGLFSNGGRGDRQEWGGDHF